MKDKPTHIRYTSYGSNISEERFLTYIKGGKLAGSEKIYEGCRDKNLPIEDNQVFICSEIYFAQESKTWDNGGVAFIRNAFSDDVQTFGREYLITTEQFEDIVKQENGKRTAENISIDYDAAIQHGQGAIDDVSWYNALVYLGEDEDGIPAFTFTHKEDYTNFVKPCVRYLQCIISGIKELYTNYTDEEILMNFKDRGGIKSRYTDEELLKIIAES